MIEILATGPLATIQDLGRQGFAALGVSHSGAFDRGAAALANRLVGNPVNVPVIEVTFGGLALHAVDAATIAITGAACPGVENGTAQSLPAGRRILLGAPARGLRSYVAVRGGFAAQRTLGSASTDLLSGLGPAPLRPGDLLRVGSQPAGPVSETAAAARALGVPLPVLPGPRTEWFTSGALDDLTVQTWTVRAESDRVGIRLRGRPLRRTNADELPSEPTRPGAIQIPADGHPIIFGPDAPVTGGYPVLAVLADLDLAAQLRPGDEVRFTLLR